MELCYLVMAHDRLEDLWYVLNRLSDTHVHFVVHVDCKCKDNLDRLEGIRNCMLLPERMSVEWGGISVVECVLSLCRWAMEHGSFDYFVLLSGSDYPVKPTDYIYHYLSFHIDETYVEGVSLPNFCSPWIQGGYRRLAAYAIQLDAKSIATVEPRRLDWNNFRQLAKVFIRNPRRLGKALSVFLFAKRRVMPGGLQPYGGEMWWMMNRNSLSVILDYLAIHPEYVEYHRSTQVPDELFFNTLAHNLCVGVENRGGRYVHWRKRTDLSPQWLTLVDKACLRDCIEDPDCLFVRKVKDKDVIQYIDTLADEKWNG